MANQKAELLTAVEDYTNQPIGPIFETFYTYVKNQIDRDLENIYLYSRRYTDIQSDTGKEFNIELENNVYRLVDLYIVDPATDRRLGRVNNFRVEASDVQGVDNEMFIPDGLDNGTRIELVYKRKVSDDDTGRFYNVFSEALLERAYRWLKDINRAELHKQQYLENVDKENSEFHLNDNFIYPSADW